MVITEIKQQQKRANFFSIFVDNKYAFSLSELGLINSGIKVGQEVDVKQYRDLKKDASFDRLYNKALFYISLRPRSEWEITTYLNKNSTSPHLSKRILNKLRDTNLVDDEMFTKFWIENRKLTKPISKRRLIAELRSKRVGSETISRFIEEIEIDDLSTLEELVIKKRSLSRFKNDDLKLMQYLARQGYNYQDIKSVLQKED